MLYVSLQFEIIFYEFTQSRTYLVILTQPQLTCKLIKNNRACAEYNLRVIIYRLRRRLTGVLYRQFLRKL